MPYDCIKFARLRVSVGSRVKENNGIVQVHCEDWKEALAGKFNRVVLSSVADTTGVQGGG